MAKPDDKTFKNRHVPHDADDPSDYVFPSSEKQTKQYCSVDEILDLFKPVKKKRGKATKQRIMEQNNNTYI